MNPKRLKNLESAMRLKSTIQMAGYDSITQFCERHDLSRSLLYHYTNGTYPLTQKALNKYLPFLENADAHWILHGSKQERLKTHLLKAAIDETLPLLLKDKISTEHYSNVISKIYEDVIETSSDQEKWPELIKLSIKHHSN